jgi:hypothetical protein
MVHGKYQRNRITAPRDFLGISSLYPELSLTSRPLTITRDNSAKTRPFSMVLHSKRSALSALHSDEVVFQVLYVVERNKSTLCPCYRLLEGGSGEREGDKSISHRLCLCISNPVIRKQSQGSELHISKQGGAVR